MKHLICTLFLLSAWVLPVSAQSIYLTPRAGLNMSTITQAGGSFRTGLNFGISGEYVHTPTLAAEAGLYYSMQGSYFKDQHVSPEHDYLLIPILFKYYIKGVESEGPKKGFSVSAGPQIDIKAAVNTVGYTPGRSYGQLLPDDMTKALGFSFVVGGGYLFDSGLVVSANLNFGLTNKAKDRFRNIDDTDIIPTLTHRDVVLQFNFGYRFAIH